MDTLRDSLLIGVDGGGTTCRLALLHGGRRVELRTGPANVSTDLTGALARLSEGLKALATQAGLPPAELARARAYLGLAGVVSADLARAVAEALPFASVRVEDDRIAALHGALGGQDGTVFGIGTGSFLGRRVGAEVSLIGGWGFVLGDEASGADLGRRLLRAALHAVDGLAPATDLTDAILAEKGGAAGVVAFAGRATPADFAALAPRLLDAATAGDGTALALLRQGADYIARGVNRLGWQPGEALCPIGGLAASYTPYLPAPMAASLVDPQGSALDGALALAARIAAEGAAP
jgi:glucosamine kinase